METVFQMAEVDMIPLETGARMFTDEVLTQGGESVLISGNLGILDQNKSVRMAGVVLPPGFSSEYGTASRHPMIDVITYLSLIHI